MASQDLVDRSVAKDVRPPTLAVPNPAQARTGLDPAKALRDAVLAGAVALGLFAPLIGLLTVSDGGNALTLEPRWRLLAVMVGIVVLGRLALTTLVWPWIAARRLRPNASKVRLEHAREAKLAGRIASPLLILFTLAFPFVVLELAGPTGSLKWIDNYGIQILIYVMLGWGLNVVVGLAGLLDLGYVAFYAVGAYSYAILAGTFGLSFWLLLPVAGVLAAAWGVILGLPVLRLRGDYLAIVTLAFGEIIRLVLINWKAFSNGYEGLPAPRPTFFGIPFTAGPNGFAHVFGLTFRPIQRTIFLYYIILALALVTAYVTRRLRSLPVGRAWEALREDEIACRSLGINTVTTKLTAFATGAMFGGFAGAFFAARQGFISPESFIFNESAIILAIVVLGGMGSLVGVVISATVIIGGTELMRELDVLKAVFGQGFDPAQYRLLIFGLGMVLIMLWKPRGLISSRTPTAFVRERKEVSGDLVQEGHG